MRTITTIPDIENNTPKDNFLAVTQETRKDDLLKLIPSLDPLVGDFSCHLHHTCLLIIYLRLLKQGSLSDTEIHYLNACRILTLTSDVTHNLQSGLMRLAKTNIEKLPNELKKEYGSNHAITQLKVRVATFSCALVSEILKTDPNFFDSSMTDYIHNSHHHDGIARSEKIESKLYFSLSHKKIPVTPFYLSCKVMFKILAETSTLLTIHFRRFNKVEQTFNDFKLFYRYEPATHGFVNVFDTAVRENEIAIAIQMYGFLFSHLSKGIDPCFSEPDPRLFIERFSRLDIAMLILSCAAGHAAVPKNTEGELINKAQQDFSVNRELNATGDTEYSIDHEACRLSEYHALAHFAIRYGVFNPAAVLDHSVPVPYQVVHVSTELAKANITSNAFHSCAAV